MLHVSEDGNASQTSSSHGEIEHSRGPPVRRKVSTSVFLDAAWVGSRQSGRAVKRDTTAIKGNQTRENEKDGKQQRRDIPWTGDRKVIGLSINLGPEKRNGWGK